MRDKTRIKRILSKLEDFWTENPDLRLGQIIVCCKPKDTKTDLFYIEDNIIERELDMMMDGPK